MGRFKPPIRSCDQGKATPALCRACPLLGFVLNCGSDGAEDKRKRWVVIWNRANQPTWRRLFAAILIVAIASALRVGFLGGLGRGIPYVWFYPAVIIAALYGGLPAGILATVLSALLVFYWVLRGLMSQVEMLAMAVFIVSCIAISTIIEGLHRAHERSKQTIELLKAEAKARKQVNKATALCAELSVRFINIPFEQLDELIREAQHSICECLSLDMSTLWQVVNEAPGDLQLTHFYRPLGDPPRDERMLARDNFPWTFRQVMAGGALVVPSVDELPREAGRDQEVWRQYGVKSTLVLPLSVGRAWPIGALSFAAQRVECTWPDEIVNCLQLIAQVFANAIVRRQQGETIREREGRISGILESIQDVYFAADLQGRFTVISRSGPLVYGYDSIDEMMAVPVSELYYGPEDRQRLHKRLQSEGYIHDWVGEARKKDGSFFWASMNAQYVRDQEGRIVGTEGVIRDITERMRAETALRESEEQFRRVFENSPLGIYRTTPDGQILMANPALLDMLQFRSFDDLARENLEQTGFHPRYPRRFFKEAMERDGMVRGLESAWARSDGTTLIVRENAQALRDADGKIIYYDGIVENVTERKKTEDALIESEEKFTKLFRSAPVAIVLSTIEDGTILDANEAFIRLLGHSLEGIVGRTVVDIGWIDQDARRRLAERMRAEAHVTNLEMTWTAKGGRRIDCIYDGEIVEVGAKRLMLSILLDVTERKRVEEALRIEHSLFESLSSTIPDAIYIKDRQSRFVRINDAMALLAGLRSPAEAVGKTDFDIFIGEHSQQAYDDEQRIMSSGEPLIDFEEKETWADGRVRWVSSTKMPLRDTSGNVTGLVGISRDITARKEANERIQEQASLLDTASDGIMVRDLQHRILYWNKGCERLYGWSAKEALEQQSHHLLMADRKSFDPAFAEVLRSGAWTGELSLLTKAGQEISVLSRWSLVRDSQGQPKSVLVINTDITERKKLEAQLFRAQRLENIGMLASGIAHDLNNVLAPIGLVSGLLRSRITESSSVKLLETVEQSVERGAGLIRQILGFAHGVGGEHGPLQLKHLVRDIAGMVIETFPKSITCEVKIPGELWPIMGNPTQIHQVLLNLCVNARDAMPQGGALHLQAENCVLDDAMAARIDGAKPGRWVVLHVQDTGTGIPPEALSRIWDPFFTTKAADKGTGLGLSTVRGIVASHNGFIRLDTKQRRGTTFSVYLPASEGPVTSSGDGKSAAASHGHGELILMVDDEAAFCEMASDILTQYNYRVITDLEMPDLNGAELARAIRRIDPTKKILAMSGHPGETAGKTQMEHVTAFIQKPFSAETLLNTVDQLLHVDSQ